MTLRSDYENLKDGDVVVLYPNDKNPLHKTPTRAWYQSGYFYIGEAPIEPDFYFGDVWRYHYGFTLEDAAGR